MTEPTRERDPHAPRWRRVAACTAIALAIIALAHLLDPWAHEHVRYEALGPKNRAELDWQRFLRVLGTLYPWTAVGCVLVLADLGRPVRAPMRDAFSRGLIVILTAGAGGLLAEALKLVFGRERPPALPWGEASGHPDVFEAWAYVWRPLESWSTSGLGLPSSHAAVAAAGCFALTRLDRRFWAVAIPLAALSALSRVAIGAHFLSDVALGVFVGGFAGWLIWRAHLALPGRVR